MLVTGSLQPICSQQNIAQAFLSVLASKLLVTISSRAIVMRALEKTCERERATREHGRVAREHERVTREQERVDRERERATREHCHECYVQ